ncbi:hypothetical protein E1262_15240 [Jiangella aurantiaca]|uniref:Uncharacterized protein n=1 Tax=Jiangella aurantiaca TaxID=2530373 RepID=A0A4R5ACR1_9ACTN|nr:hypothetical protein [Jiangella aurantiaca]TDD68604.1 hypothetical protein E1262_15240 [Jiangella aurantiaca]
MAPRRGRFRLRRRRFADVVTPAFARDLRGTLLLVQWTASALIVLVLVGAVLVAGLRTGL